MKEIAILIFLILISTIALLSITYILKNVMYAFSPVFAGLNYVQWFLYNPLRFLYKDKDSEFPRKMFLFLRLTFVSPMLTLLIHILMTPLRIITSLYYDVLLFWSITIDDSLNELFDPKLGTYRKQKGFEYLWHWIYGFPHRFLMLINRLFTIILDSFCMVGISILLPTFTMYHGTSLKKAASKIGQQGNWFVGSGNWSGTGVYFGVVKRVAVNYAPKNDDASVLIVRVSPTFVRPASTLKPNIRKYIKKDGEKLSKNLPFPYKTIEHYRDNKINNKTWWEYCLAQPGKMNHYINTWRIRPVAVSSTDDEIIRLWGGITHYSNRIQNILVSFTCWVIITILFVFLNRI